MTRRIVSLTLTALCLIIMAGTAQAVTYSLEVTGTFFGSMPTPLGLCADLSPSASSKPVTFTGITPYAIKVKAGPVLSKTDDVLGNNACVNANWAQNIYTVTAYAKLNGSGVTSPPVAVSRFNPKYFCGLQGGGALHLLSYGVPPNIQHELPPGRQATYAIIDKLNPGKNFGILYYDNDNPLGPVSFVAKSYEFANIQSIAGVPPFNQAEFMGTTRAVVHGVSMIVHYYVRADDFPGANFFYLELRDYRWKLVYESAGPSVIDQDAEQRVYDGMNVIVLCGG